VVLHPFGFDTFGLPAEQYAIETGRHPAVTSAENVDLMRRQLRRLGLGHDPTRELSTADPRLYRWTQWILLQVCGAWVSPPAPPGPWPSSWSGAWGRRRGRPTPMAGRGPSSTRSSGAGWSTPTASPTWTRRRSTGARGCEPSLHSMR